MNPTKDISIDVITNEKFIQTIGGGGLKIEINGERINRYVDEDEYDWSDWHPEYVGDDIATDLWNLITTTTEVFRDRSLFEVMYVDFNELRSVLLLEYLGEGTVRVAFRVAEPAHAAEATLFATPESACGYPVEIDAWGQAVLRVGQRFRDELVELGHDNPGEDGIFDPILADLSHQLSDV